MPAVASMDSEAVFSKRERSCSMFLAVKSPAGENSMFRDVRAFVLRRNAGLTLLPFCNNDPTSFKDAFELV